MAKPFITFALVRDTYGPGHRVLGVVNEVRRILYGRWLDTDAVTNVAERDVVLRYDHPKQAEAAAKRVEAAYRAATPAVENARIAERQARDEREAAVLRAAQPCLHPPRNIVSDNETAWCEVCETPVDGDLTRPFTGGPKA